MALRASSNGTRVPKAVKHLERLQRVLLHARAKCSLQDSMNIDEQSRSQHAIDFVFTRRMPAHKSLQSRGFVRCEMVDMHRWVLRPARHDPIDKPFERPPFLVRRHRPAAVVGLPTCRIFPTKTEEVFPSADTNKWISFQVKENVSGRGFRQQRETVFIGDLEYLMDRPAPISSSYLNPCLLADFDVSLLCPEYAEADDRRSVRSRCACGG